MTEPISEWDRLRYVPKPGEPALPPQLSEYTEKSTDDVMKALNRLPFFMTELDETDGEGGENANLEALKSLAYEGEPHEIAGNFKNQGNDCYKAKQYKNAEIYYTKGIDDDCNDNALNAALYLNRAACNLELKNYRRCIEDCKKVLILDDKNIKACFRAAKALFLVERYDESKQLLNYGLSIDSSNTSLLQLSRQVDEKVKKIEEAKQRKEKEENERKMKQSILDNSIKLRHIQVVKSTRPPELLEEATIRLEDPTDYESQLIFPAMILYPTIDEFDFVAEISELSTPSEILSIVFDRPKEWFEDPKHAGFKPEKMVCFMETISGGLIKIGKNVAINTALMADSPKAPLFDNGLRLYVVTKEASKQWISTWDKLVALAKRQVGQ